LGTAAAGISGTFGFGGASVFVEQAAMPSAKNIRPTRRHARGLVRLMALAARANFLEVSDTPLPQYWAGPVSQKRAPDSSA